MGAGIHRWWQVDGEAYHHEIVEWKRQQQMGLAQAIVVAPRRELSVIRRAVQAFAELWKVAP